MQIPKDKVDFVINYLYGLLISPKYRKLNVSSNISIEKIRNRIYSAKLR